MFRKEFINLLHFILSYQFLGIMDLISLNVPIHCVPWHLWILLVTCTHCFGNIIEHLFYILWHWEQWTTICYRKLRDRHVDFTCANIFCNILFDLKQCSKVQRLNLETQTFIQCYWCLVHGSFNPLLYFSGELMHFRLFESFTQGSVSFLSAWLQLYPGTNDIISGSLDTVTMVI